MKITELMIGDWVFNKHHKKYIQITPYDFFNYTHLPSGKQYFVGEPEVVSGRDFEPIPLTAEILEKNGFDKFLGLGRFVSKYIKTQEVSIMIDVLFCKDSHIVVDIEKQSFIEGTRNSLHSCDIQALHEFQQALRICDLSDLANNLKLEE